MSSTLSLETHRVLKGTQNRSDGQDRKTLAATRRDHGCVSCARSQLNFRRRQAPPIFTDSVSKVRVFHLMIYAFPPTPGRENLAFASQRLKIASCLPVEQR